MLTAEFHVFLPQIRLSPKEIAERAVSAEAAGFTGIALMDHVWAPLAEYQPAYEAIVTATWIAARTNRLKVGHLVLCDALRHPAVLAKQAVTLDHASGGRFELGLGWGSVPAELDAIGVGDTPQGRVARLGESLEILRQALAGEPLEFSGKYLAVRGPPLQPLPLDRIPILIGGAGPRTLDLAGFADWWNLPTYALDRLEHVRDKVGVPLSIQEMIVLLHPDDDLAEVTATATRRFGAMSPVIGTASELVEHYASLIERGVGRFYVWFSDFARASTLAQFGADVIGPLSTDMPTEQHVFPDRDQPGPIQAAMCCSGALSVRSYDPVPLSSLSFWSLTADERDESFSELRRHRPVSWHPPFEGAMMPSLESAGGYWAVVRHADVVAVSRNPEVFCSGEGIMLEDVPPAVLDAAQSFLAMDAPRHTMLRRLVSSAFTPRQVARIEDQIVAQAVAIVDDALGGPAEFDFVNGVSKRLPMWTISDMMGVPLDAREAVTNAADSVVSWNDPDILGDRQPLELLLDSLVTMHTTARALAEARRVDPADDLMTALVQAEVEGERLTDDEICAFFVLLSVAGNDTTRNSISHGMKALCDHPDQRALLTRAFDEQIGTAVEEIVRWATPVMTFRRTATRDTEIAGQPIAAGDKVVMFYAAANRDETAFPHADRFDITRHPNEHVGFGGGGPHFCMGASLARRQLRAIFRELLHRVPDLELGAPELLVGNFIHGVTKMTAHR